MYRPTCLLPTMPTNPQLRFHRASSRSPRALHMDEPIVMMADSSVCSAQVRQYFTDPNFYALDAKERRLCPRNTKGLAGAARRFRDQLVLGKGFDSYDDDSGSKDQGGGRSTDITGDGFLCEAFAPSAATVKVRCRKYVVPSGTGWASTAVRLHRVLLATGRESRRKILLACPDVPSSRSAAN